MVAVKSSQYPLVLNKEHYTIMDNGLAKGKQDMNVNEAKLIRIAITQVLKDDDDFRTYSVKIQELADFMEIPASNLYRDIRDICESLMKQIVYIGTNNPKNPWKMFHWISYAEYDGNGNITLRLSDEIKPYVLNLVKYNKYRLEYILKMNSFYAIRLYEIIKADEFKGKEYIDFKISELREILECEKKHSRISDFKKYVIEIAEREINSKTDIRIKIEYLKNGRAIDTIRIYLLFPGYLKSKRSGILNKIEINRKAARRP